MRKSAPVLMFFWLLSLAALPAQAQSCGGSFGEFTSQLAQESQARGYDRALVKQFFANAKRDPTVIKADRAQGVFQKPFTEFARHLISANRLKTGAKMRKKWSRVLSRAEQEYGVSRGVLLAFWAFETDFGAFQGNFNTRNALLTLAHDCRRPELFRPQVFAALELYRRGLFDPNSTTGAWAGEIGMVQMLPADILHNGVDGDGDGRVSLKTSPADALLSGAKMLRELGWRANEPWLQEIQVPGGFDWSLTGLGTTKTVGEWRKLGIKLRAPSSAPARVQASVILPQGRNGPAFLAYPNFSVLFEWNQSFVYVLTAAYFGTRLEGAPVFDVGSPARGLNGKQMISLQKKLMAKGYDVGKPDGILGAKTRAAVQDMQRRLGLPADAWPTPALLKRL